MILKDETGQIIFDFTNFPLAEHYDTKENACTGLKIVDFIAENADSHIFIETKNYVVASDNSKVQENIKLNRERDYRMLTDTDAAFPLEIGMKFKDSILRYLASGSVFKKQIILLLVMNSPSLQNRDRERLIRKIRGYIPSGINAKLDEYPLMKPIFFDMPSVEEVLERYGFSVVIQ